MAKSPKTIKLTAMLETSEHASGWHFVSVSREVGERFQTDGKTRRVVCTLNGAHSFQCALMPNGGSFFILVNKKIRTALNISAGDTLKVVLESDTSKYGLPMPEEFEEVFRQDPEGDKLFHALTPGRQRSLIYVVSSGKDVDRRIHRALIVVGHLKDNNGKIDNKKLYYELQRPLM
ncbi:MAG TPA: YdeI/OmpD-associated family protein [Pyrinomonadaceae bacterium]|nr:YdeI/OmpD-associated family protein [Pyrinomonadaceae bacterium]